MALKNVPFLLPLPVRGGQRASTPDQLLASTTYQLQATRLINEAIRRPSRATIDANIAAVTILANRQSFVGDGPQAEHHLNGLERMIRLRGGLEALPIPLAQRIQRVDTNFVAITSVKPRFPLLSTEKTDIPQVMRMAGKSQVFEQTLPLLGSGIQTSRIAGLICQDLHDVFAEIQALGRFFDIWKRGEAVFLDLVNDFCEMRIVAVETKLSSMSFDESDGKTGLVQESCRIAALLFINTFFWLWRKWNNMLGPLVAHLKRTLGTARLVGCWNEIPSDLQVWVLFLGRYAANQPDGVAWFEHRLTSATQRLCTTS